MKLYYNPKDELHWSTFGEDTKYYHYYGTNQWHNHLIKFFDINNEILILEY